MHFLVTIWLHLGTGASEEDAETHRDEMLRKAKTLTNDKQGIESVTIPTLRTLVL